MDLPFELARWTLLFPAVLTFAECTLAGTTGILSVEALTFVFNFACTTGVGGTAVPDAFTADATSGRFPATVIG